MKKVYFLALTPLLLTGCFDSDDDDDTVNTSPDAVSESFATEVGTAFSDQLTASDADGDPLSFSVVQEPSLGSVTLNEDGSFTYTPGDEQTGEDSFVFAVSDGVNDPVEATVTITVEAQQVAVSSYVRAAFAQSATDTPLPVNGRDFQQDVEDPTAFDDLINQ